MTDHVLVVPQGLAEKHPQIAGAILAAANQQHRQLVSRIRDTFTSYAQQEDIITSERLDGMRGSMTELYQELKAAEKALAEAEKQNALYNNAERAAD